MPGGALIAVTNSVHHLRELRELLAYPSGAFELSFNSENGEQRLRRHFARIERFDTVVTATVSRTREARRLPGLGLGSGRGAVPEDVELPFVVHGRTTIFVATT